MQGAERLGTPRLLYPDREEMREAFSLDWDETKKVLRAVFRKAPVARILIFPLAYMQ